ncbi:MAG: alkaline phosphatase [Pseudomonadota bacterium]
MRLLIYASALALIAMDALAQDLPQANDAWFTEAQSAIRERLAITPNTNTAKNVILFISDGNGVGTNYATRLYDGQRNGNFGDENVLHYETYPYLGLAKTYNVNAQTPDSAGTGTAMHTGIKTRLGVLGVNETVIRGDCAAVAGATVASISDVATAMGKSVGIVSTARITHATPGSVYAHTADRRFENDTDVPDGCDVPDIASQLIGEMQAGRIDVAFGGGRRNFLLEGDGGRRSQDDLVEIATARGIKYASNVTEADDLPLDGSAPLLGLFAWSHMSYEADRDPAQQPSLAEMTEIAITALQNNSSGFFLSVEAGRVDTANHANNVARTVTDGVAFTEAIIKADEMTDDADTLIIVTADHAHAIAFNGYCGRGSDILGLCYGVAHDGIAHTDAPEIAKDGKPYTVVGYLNGPSSILREDKDWSGKRPDLDQEEATDLDYVQQALIPKSAETHSGEDVAIYAKGPYAHLMTGTVEQNYVFHVMDYAMKAQ